MPTAVGVDIHQATDLRTRETVMTQRMNTATPVTGCQRASNLTQPHRSQPRGRRRTLTNRLSKLSNLMIQRSTATIPMAACGEVGLGNRERPMRSETSDLVAEGRPRARLGKMKAQGQGRS